jgi:hypothetical protein
MDLSVSLSNMPGFLNPELISFSIWNAISFVGIVITYFPRSQTRARGEAAKQILREIDYFGGFTSITGLTLL